MEPTSLENKIYRKLKEVETYAEYSSEQINRMIDQMEPVKRKLFGPSCFEADEHIQKSFIKCSVQIMPIQNLIFEMAGQRNLQS